MYPITLQPQVAGISLAYGQTTQMQSPSAFTCKGDAASISASVYNYGTTNNQLADVSPPAALRRHMEPQYRRRYCRLYLLLLPQSLPPPDGLPYAVAYITATAYSVTSNPVAVYIHAPVTNISLVTILAFQLPAAMLLAEPDGQLDAQACYVATDSSGVSHQYEFCAPSSVPQQLCVFRRSGARRYLGPQLQSSIGTLNFSVGNSNSRRHH